jgi:hypothetical protein
LGLGVALVVGVMLVSASGAATTKAQKVTKIDVSTRAAVVNYLRSIHVNPKGAVIQRGLRNYAGARCPGSHWACVSTKHTVVQIARQGGQNRFACTSSNCVVVQVSGTAHGVYLSARQGASTAAANKGGNSGTCVKTGSGALTGGGQTCAIIQTGSGLNTAVIYENTMKVSGLVQTAQYAASIQQTSSGSAGNVACVTQNMTLDGSTSNTNGKPTTVSIQAHQSIKITQDNTGTGTNSAQNAATSTGACDGTPLTQTQALSSTVSATGPITQGLDNSYILCGDGVSGEYANLCLDIEQNKGVGFGSSISGANNANFSQTSSQTEIANNPKGAVAQTESTPLCNDPGALAGCVFPGGLVGTINQDSSVGSTATAFQNETQCEDAATAGLIACSNTPDSPSIPGGLTQKEYGPVGVGNVHSIQQGPVHFQRGKGLGQSIQTGGTNNQFTVTQNSSQNADQNATLVNNGQADCDTSGGSCKASQTTTINSSTTTDGYTAPNIGKLVIDCPTGTSCTGTAPPVPTITPLSKGPTVVEVGTGKTFQFTDVATAGVKFQCSPSGLANTWTDCTTGDSNATFANSTAGTYSFYVRAANDTGTLNPSAADHFTWNVVDANVSITPSSSASEVGHSQTFTITTNDLPAGTTATLTSITPAVTGGTESDTCGAPTPGANSASCTVTVNDTSAASITVTATAVWHFTDGTNSVDVTRSTDGTHDSSMGATAQFVDAYITLSPLALSQTAGTNTPMTATVYTNDGSGWVLAGGVNVAFSLSNSGGAGAVFIPSPANNCTTSALGTCSVTINSGPTGQTTVHAATTNLSVADVSLSRATGDTNPPDSTDALITWHT